MNNYEYKKESVIILCCIIIIIVFYFLYFIKNKIIKNIEMFYGKREKLEQISKIDNGYDPDEITDDNPYDDLCNDPDGDYKCNLN